MSSTVESLSDRRTTNGKGRKKDVEHTLAAAASIIRSQPRRPQRPDAAPGDRIDVPTLAAFADVVAAADEALTAAVAYLRAEGYSWDDVADGLGLKSRQAAQQRFERRGVK